jgi:hypothetical protein
MTDIPTWVVYVMMLVIALMICYFDTGEEDEDDE